jgi:hypothetical protein
MRVYARSQPTPSTTDVVESCQLRKCQEHFVNFNHDYNRRMILKLITRYNRLLSVLKFAVSRLTATTWIQGHTSVLSLLRPGPTFQFINSRKTYSLYRAFYDESEQAGSAVLMLGTRAHHCALFWARWIKPAHLHPIFLRFMRVLYSHLCLGLPSGLVSSVCLFVV